MPFHNTTFLLGFTLGLIATLTFALAMTFPTLAALGNFIVMLTVGFHLHRRQPAPAPVRVRTR